MQVKRWRDKYDGSWESLRNRSCRPHSHRNQHIEVELMLIQKPHRRYGHEGLAQVFLSVIKEAIHAAMIVCVNRFEIETGIKKGKLQRGDIQNQSGSPIK